MMSDMQIAANIGGSRLDIISSEWPVKVINEKVHVIETAIINKGTRIVFKDLNKIKRTILINVSEMRRYILRFFSISFT